MRILLTGATGFLGGAVAAELATRGLLGDTVFLVRAPDAETGAQRVRANLAGFGVDAAQMQAVASARVIAGDLAGIPALAESPLLGGLTHVLHCAALATFSNNPSIWASNVDGTLALAQAVTARSDLTRWVQVGTAMCCGPGLTSPVSESWSLGTRDEAHLVPYTRSKLAAELALRDMPGVPLVAARPSIVVGHTRLGCAPSPSIFWVFRMAFALERFTCAPDERVDIIPADWCARALVSLLIKPRLAHDLYHVSGGMGSDRFVDIDAAYAAARGTPPIAPRYEQVPVERLRELVPLFEQRLGRVNRLLILRALMLYGAFAELNYVFDNARLLTEGIEPAPPLSSYIDRCVATSEGIPMTEQMAHDFK